MAAAGLDFNQLTPAQVDALMADLPRPQRSEPPMAIMLLDMMLGIEDRSISMFMRLQGKTREEAVAFISPTGGQGFTKCGCKGSCDTNTCKCKKLNLLCNSRCHAGNASCRNQH